MLRAGLITPSTSPFLSPVLLVKKKDQNWRFYVDFRHLNAITIKKVYPMPIIDELLDEIAGSSWFSKLDLCAGYHQIRMAEGEEFKTTFQMHHDHFEFKVLSFGLAGALGTFNGGMTDTLHLLMRVCVLTFFDDILVFTKTLPDHIKHR